MWLVPPLLKVRALLPLPPGGTTLVGRAMDCTRSPARVYSSMKPGREVPELAILSTVTLPGAKGVWLAWALGSLDWMRKSSKR